jgi:polysaccharide chain length determinant protein (PEP-CTERM system associated)
MPEEFEQETSQGFDAGRLLDIVRRRHLQFLVPLLVGWLLVWGSSWFLQARYKSATSILVEAPAMPKNYVAPNINDDLQARLQSISQQILSRTRLLIIINELNLYSGKNTHGLSADEKVERMKKDIDIELVHDREGAIQAFTISYSAPDPHTAQQVTGKLTSLFIDENLKVRQQQSEDTTQFMQNQLEAARGSLALQEAKIRDFQAAHEGELPTQQTTNLQILGGLQAQYQSEQQALNTAKQQRIYIQTSIDQYRTLQSTSTTGGADGSSSGLPAVDRQLETLRSQLSELSSHYTDNYPDVRRVKSEIAKTEKIRGNLIAEMKKNASNPDSAAASHEVVDPTQSGPLIQLEGQLHANQVEIASREQAIAALNGKIGEYQRRLNGEPASEQQLADLTRGYDQSKANYDELLKKESDSRMATSMEQLQQGERFTILDPPSLPVKPAFPNRLKMCGMGFGVGAFLGLLVVGVMEFLDDRMHSDKEIKALLPTAVISEVPEMLTAADHLRDRRRVMLGWAMAVVVFCIILAGSAFSYLHS